MIGPLILLSVAAASGQGALRPAVEAPDLSAWHAAIANGDTEAAGAFVAPDAAISIYSYGQPVTGSVADLVGRLRPCTLVEPWSDRTIKLRYQWGSIYQCPTDRVPLEYFLEMNVEAGRITGALLYANAVAMPAPRVN